MYRRAGGEGGGGRDLWLQLVISSNGKHYWDFFCIFEPYYDWKLYFLLKIKTVPADWQFLSSIARLGGWQGCHLLLYLFSIEDQSVFCWDKNPDNVVVSFYVLWEIYNRCMTAITSASPDLVGFTLKILIKYLMMWWGLDSGGEREEGEETELSRQVRGNPSWLVMISSSRTASQPLGLGLRLLRLLTSGFTGN